jgi:hypothetical protein
MAKFTPILGNISGKIAGSVFAFNKAGFYIRSFRSPVQPNTLNQLTARGLFGAAVTLWHSLSDVQKGEWNAFATSAFKAKHPVTGMIYSGYNAFVSLYNQASNLAMRMNADPSEVIYPVGVTNTPTVFMPSQDAPNSTLSGNITDFQGNPLSIQLYDFVYNRTDQKWTSTFLLVGNTGPTIAGTGPNFIDPVSLQDVGIAIYISKPVQQINQFVPNPEFNLLTVIEPLGQTDEWTTAARIEIESFSITQFDHAKYQPVQNAIYQANAYLVAKNGQSVSIGAAKFTYDAIP